MNNMINDKEMSYEERKSRLNSLIPGIIPFQRMEIKENTLSALPSGRSLIKEEDTIEDSTIAVNSLPETAIHSHPEFRNGFPLPLSREKTSTVTSITTNKS